CFSILFDILDFIGVKALRWYLLLVDFPGDWFLRLIAFPGAGKFLLDRLSLNSPEFLLEFELPGDCNLKKSSSSIKIAFNSSCLNPMSSSIFSSCSFTAAY